MKCATKDKMKNLVLELQKYLCDQIQKLEDGRKFTVDDWDRKNGDETFGEGRTCSLEDANVIERAGVCVSTIQGILSELAIQGMRSRGHVDIPDNAKYFVTGLSVIMHPQNPHVCTMHLNTRYFEVEKADGDIIWWFGGGVDLTPYYKDEDHFSAFHKALKEACDQLSPSLYPLYKKQADEYFFNAVRGEHRGIGGIFYDDLNSYPKDDLFAFAKRSTLAAIDSYVTHVGERMGKPFTLTEREWQLFRRGRYVEFNLIYDRGTKFGIHNPNSSIDTVFLSLPRVVTWKYGYKPERDSAEYEMLDILVKPREWT